MRKKNVENNKTWRKWKCKKCVYVYNACGHSTALANTETAVELWFVIAFLLSWLITVRWLPRLITQQLFHLDIYHYRTLIGSHYLRVDWYCQRAALINGITWNRVFVLFDFDTWRRGYYPHSGLVCFNAAFTALTRIDSAFYLRSTVLRQPRRRNFLMEDMFCIIMINFVEIGRTVAKIPRFCRFVVFFPSWM